MTTKTAQSAISAIQAHGILLVYPIDNRKKPQSLWSVFYPKTRMRWEWDQDGDDRVARLWQLREELSRSGEVVYSKWYRGRATFFSKTIFESLLALMGTTRVTWQASLGQDSAQILELLRLDSPLSTKQIKKSLDLTGRSMEPRFNRAMQELWQKLFIVGYGEVDDGAFPSLATGCTQLLFEDLWGGAHRLSPDTARQTLVGQLGAESLFVRYLEKLKVKHRATSLR